MAEMGTQLWQRLREHLLQYWRVANGTVKRRDAVRQVIRRRILESEMEICRAFIRGFRNRFTLGVG